MKKQVGVCRRQTCLIPPTLVVTNQPLEWEESLQKGSSHESSAQDPDASSWAPPPNTAAARSQASGLLERGDVKVIALAPHLCKLSHQKLWLMMSLGGDTHA